MAGGTAFQELSRNEVENLLLAANYRVENLLRLLKLAQPYVEHAASLKPTTYSRTEKMLQAKRDAHRIAVGMQPPPVLTDADREACDRSLATIATALDASPAA